MQRFCTILPVYLAHFSRARDHITSLCNLSALIQQALIRRKNWCKKGTRRQKRGDRRKGRINVMGGVRYSDKKRWVDFIPSGNSANFYAMLKNFYGDLRAEWILQGNLAEDFQNKGCKFVIILDNASFHKKAEILQKIAAEMPNLIIEFLPKYSPDYNLIELVWHSAKEYVAKRLFEPTFRRYLDKFNSFKLGGIKPWNQYIATVSSIAKSI